MEALDIPEFKTRNGGRLREAALRSAAKKMVAEGRGTFHKDVNPDTAILRILDFDPNCMVKLRHISFSDVRPKLGEPLTKEYNPDTIRVCILFLINPDEFDPSTYYLKAEVPLKDVAFRNYRPDMGFLPFGIHDKSTMCSLRSIFGGYLAWDVQPFTVI